MTLPKSSNTSAVPYKSTLKPDQIITLEPDNIPAVAEPIGAKCFVVQELKLKGVTIRYRRQRYKVIL